MAISTNSGKTNSFFGLSAEPIYALIEKDVEAFEKNSLIKEIFQMNTSKNFAEKVTSATAAGGFKPVAEGGAYPEDDIEEGYSKTFYHQVFKDSLTITREMADDGKILGNKTLTKKLAQAYGRLREEFGAAILAGGVTTSINYKGKEFNTKSADGKALFATDHPSITGETGVQSNVFSNVFSEDVLGKVESAMQNFRDDKGNVLAIAPTHIIIPNSHTLKKAVFAAIGADKESTSANNAFNYQYGRWSVLVWPYLNKFLTNDLVNKFFALFDKSYNENVGTLQWFDRVKFEVNDYIDENTDNWVFKAYSRFTAGANDWRGIAAGGVTGGTTLT